MNILFISHSAGRTGAPYLLLSILEWFKQNTAHHIRVLTKHDGPLRRDFSKLAETMSFEQFTSAPGDTGVRLRQHYHDVELIYSNTGTNGVILAALAPLQRPVITHMHEMRYALAMWSDNAFDHVLRQTTTWICASRPVRDNLCRNHGVAPDETVIIPDFIDLPASSTNTNGRRELTDHRRRLLDELGLADPVRLVLGAGTFDWRKGADLFIQVCGYATRLREQETDLHFVWIGDEGYDDIMRLRTGIEVDGLNIGSRLHLLGFRDDLQACIAQCDAFLLTSREDPCPLVALAAAALAKPVICFEKAGGIADLVAQGAGIAVPFMDAHAMAGAIFSVLDSPENANALGKLGAERVRAEHSLEGNARKIYRLLDDVLAQWKQGGQAAEASAAPVGPRGTINFLILKATGWALRLHATIRGRGA